MPRFQLKTSKIVGASAEKGWSQVHTFIPQEKEKLDARGQLLAVISLSGLKEEVAMPVAGRELIGRLHEEYYGQLDDAAFGCLKAAVKKVCRETETEAQVEIVAAVLVANILYLAIAGEGRAVLCRRRKTAIILAGSENSVQTASGFLQANDLFLLGTARFFKVAAQGAIQTALSTGSVEKAAEVLSPLIHGREGMALAATVIAKTEAGVEVKKAKFKQKSLGFFGKNLTRFWFFLKRKLGRATIYLKQRSEKIRPDGREKSKKTLLTIALVLLLLLGISVPFGIRQREKISQREKIEDFLQQARAKKEEAEALVSLNPSRARELFLEAQALIQQLEMEKPVSAEVSQFKEELDRALIQVLREHQVEPEAFYDLGLIKKDAMVSDAAFSGGQLIILDQTKTSIYRLGIAEKSQVIIAGGQKVAGGFQVAVFWPKVFVLTNEGLVQVEAETKKQSLVAEVDEKGIVDLQAFASNLYLLTKETIWIYPATSEGLGSKREWLKTEVDLTTAISMAIDGSIWVLKSDGLILKFTRGGKDAFGIAGLDKPLVNPSAIYTDSEQSRLYILDKGNSRVVVLAKSGEYERQYLTDKVGETIALVASEKEGKILLLTGSQVYAIEMR